MEHIQSKEIFPDWKQKLDDFQRERPYYDAVFGEHANDKKEKIVHVLISELSKDKKLEFQSQPQYGKFFYIVNESEGNFQDHLTRFSIDFSKTNLIKNSTDTDVKIPQLTQDELKQFLDTCIDLCLSLDIGLGMKPVQNDQVQWDGIYPLKKENILLTLPSKVHLYPKFKKGNNPEQNKKELEKFFTLGKTVWGEGFGVSDGSVANLLKGS